MVLPKNVIKEIRDIISTPDFNESWVDESHVIGIVHRWDDDNYINNLIEKQLDYLNKRVQENKPIYFCVEHEIIDDKKSLNYLIDSIKKYNLTTARICQATISQREYFANPLVNFYMWRNLATRKNISWDDSEENIEIVFERKKYFVGKKIQSNRKYKSICSVRKRNHWRNFLMKKMNIDNSIIRYANWPDDADDKSTNADWDKYVDNFPTIQELIEEYEQSYFSFIIESKNNEEGDIAQLSEKTIIGLVTGTMPIIFGDNNLIRDMKSAGFYTWNDYFDYKGDSLKQNKLKVKHYYDIVEKVKKLSLTETKKIYIDNLDKIQRNYDIISELIFSENHII